ncbi:MAG TPA: hypothetical protein VMU92_12380 [Acidobacteriaceae bacterium]|nr:hypothetical protein [Acidobacteriaceae bacterium]
MKLSGALQATHHNHIETISYAQLLRLPQEQFTVSNDSNFPHPVRLSGVDLDVLVRRYAARGQKIMVAALCNDGYEAHYTAEYRAEHHPFLVLKINGHAPAEMPRTRDGGSYGPYLISHKRFVPAFHILSHQDEQQIPNGVIELRFLPENHVLRALQAPGSSAGDKTMHNASILVMQNCLRCHNQGHIGGTKAHVPFQMIAVLARYSPRFFTAFVRNPTSKIPNAVMPANPQYDAQTMQALTAYFRTFLPPGKP